MITLEAFSTHGQDWRTKHFFVTAYFEKTGDLESLKYNDEIEVETLEAFVDKKLNSDITELMSCGLLKVLYQSGNFRFELPETDNWGWHDVTDILLDIDCGDLSVEILTDKAEEEFKDYAQENGLKYGNDDN